MKIYANTTDKSSRLFEQYCGTDLWIKCTAPSGITAYLRILEVYDEYGHPAMKFNALTEQHLRVIRSATDPEYAFGLLRSHIDYVHHSPLDSFTPVEPTTTLTFEELTGGLTVNIELDSWADRLVGTGSWLKVTSGRWTTASYVQFISKRNSTVVYHSVPDHFVEGYDPVGETVLPSEAAGWSMVNNIDLWNLYKPVDILSDEEMQEFLAKADKQYNEYVDEDEEYDEDEGYDEE